MGVFTGSPPEYDLLKIPGTEAVKPPGYGYAKNFYEYLQQLIGQQAPSYQGSLDPGMSPTMQMMGQLAQMYANSPLPDVYGQAQGSLSRFMAPSFTNPTARMQYGAPSYFGNNYGPEQRVPGGTKLGELPGAGGMRPFANFSPGGMPAPARPQMPYGPSNPQPGIPSFGPQPAAPRMPMSPSPGMPPTGMPSYGPTPAAPTMMPGASAPPAPYQPPYPPNQLTYQ